MNRSLLSSSDRLCGRVSRYRRPVTPGTWYRQNPRSEHTHTSRPRRGIPQRYRVRIPGYLVSGYSSYIPVTLSGYPGSQWQSQESGTQEPVALQSDYFFKVKNKTHESRLQTNWSAVRGHSSRSVSAQSHNGHWHRLGAKKKHGSEWNQTKSLGPGFGGH